VKADTILSAATDGKAGVIISVVRTMDFILNETEVRVLGSLIEKDITTPDYYPLSLNALVNACNQKSNRDPVMTLDEASVRSALQSLQEKRLAGPSSGADSRVPKFEHRFQEVFNLTRGETAILCGLLLRGPQTPGELRGRTERLFHFEELSDVQATLQKLMERDPALVRALPRQPGTKEIRYSHLLAGDVLTWEPESARGTSASSPAEADRITRLETELAEIKTDLFELKQQVAQFLKQFE